MTAEQATDLRVFRQNLADLARMQNGRAETTAEANYRNRIEQRIAEIEAEGVK